MNARAVALVVSMLAGCNDLLGIGEPSHAPDAGTDPTRPSCATGWNYRIPIELQNAASSELHDYQVKLRVDTATAIQAQKLQPSGDDLRFTTGSGDGPLPHTIEDGIDTDGTIVWVNVPVIPVGTSTLYMYYGNSLASPWTGGSTFLPDIIANPSFEEAGGWSAQPAIGPPATYSLRATWSSHGHASLLVDEEVIGDRASSSSSSFVQPIVLPFGSDYVVRLDINVIAASNGGINGSNDGGFSLLIGGGLDSQWALTGTGNITGVHLGEETDPVGPGAVPLALRVRVAAGSGPGYAKGYIDNLRVRKYVNPEPTVQVGFEESVCP